MFVTLHETPWQMDWPAIAWTLSAFYGLFIGQRSVRRTLHRRDLVAKIDPVDKALAQTHVRRESLRLTVQVMAMVVGVSAIYHYKLISPIFLLIGYQFMTVTNSRLDERDEERVREMYRERLAEVEAS